MQWTVYRGVAYDLTSFIDRHPAGNWLIQLAIGRDCTALFESYHLRPEVAVGYLKRLPVLADFPVNAVPRWAQHSSCSRRTECTHGAFACWHSCAGCRVIAS